MENFFNSHIHIFKECDVPRRFLPLQLVRVLATKPGFFVISKLLNNLNPFSDKDVLDRYIKFASTGRMDSQEKIFLQCKKYYPKETSFAVLPMDMAFMGAGKVPREYTDQLDELAALKKKYPQLIPFVHIDPRRHGFFRLLKHYVEQHGFGGVKIYPSLGYFPYDERLMPLYEYCEANGLPVTSHCSPYNPVHFKGKKSELVQLLKESASPINIKGMSRKDMCALFTYPGNWKLVLERFPKLKLYLAHFGSAYYWEKFLTEPDNEHNWFSIIKSMMKTYDNLYSDVSFTLHDKRFFPLLKVLMSNEKLQKQILFGSDYYMVQTESNERRFSLELRAYLGEDHFKRIAVENPKAFFFPKKTQ